MDLLVLGFDFYQGSFNAVDMIAPGTYGALMTHTITGAVYSSNYDSQFYFQASLPTLYDTVIYFDRTTPSVLLPFRYQ